MALYEVQSGDIQGYFRAGSPEESFLKAMKRVQRVKDKKPPMPGLLLRVREVTIDFKPIPRKDDPEGWYYMNPLDLLKTL